MSLALTLRKHGRKLSARRRALQAKLFGEDRMMSLGSGA
jgi:hypothetical protein